VKLTRPAQLLFVVAATGLLTSAASAGSRCTDDPERCVERGTTVSRPSARVVTATPALAPASLAPSVTARKSSVVTRKTTPRVAKATPRASAPSTPAPTPGMGMLLKLSNGGGDVTWQQGRSVEKDNSGASWIL